MTAANRGRGLLPVVDPGASRRRCDGRHLRASGRRHATAPASTRYRRTVITVVIVAVIAWVGWVMFVAWGMRDWKF